MIMNGRTKSLIVCLAINAIALCVFAQAESASQEFQRGKALFDKGQTKEAFKLLKSSAGKGYGPAMNAVGFCYQYGKGVSQNYTNAAQYYRNAAVQGDANGAYNYGWMYLKGVGVDKNNDVAKKWLRIAADAGNADAKTVLEQEGWLNEKPKQSKKTEPPSKKSESPSKKPDTKTYNKTRQTTKSSNRSKRYLQIKDRRYAGLWDSTCYNMSDHPHTIALRVELEDQSTHLPLQGVTVELSGKYQYKSEAKKREFSLSATSGKNGVVVLALRWQKTSKHESGVDDIEKFDMVSFKCPGYYYKDKKFSLAFFQEDMANNWVDFIKRVEDAHYFLMKFDSNFKSYNNEACSDIAFFENISSENYGTIFRGENLPRYFATNNPQREAGPFMVVPITVRMQKIPDDKS